MTGREAGTTTRSGSVEQPAGRHQPIRCDSPAGSLENYLQGLRIPIDPSACCQFDTLSLIAMQAAVGDDADAEELQNVVNSMQLVPPCTAREIHVPAKSTEIKQFADLNGKRWRWAMVSGTYGTASILLELFQIKPAEQLELDAVAAPDALRQGRWDDDLMWSAHRSGCSSARSKPASKPHLVSVTIPDKAAKTRYFSVLHRATNYPSRHLRLAGPGGRHPGGRNRAVYQRQGVQTRSAFAEPSAASPKMVYDNLDGCAVACHPKRKNDHRSRGAESATSITCVAQAFRTLRKPADGGFSIPSIPNCFSSPSNARVPPAKADNPGNRCHRLRTIVRDRSTFRRCRPIANQGGIAQIHRPIRDDFP